MDFSKRWQPRWNFILPNQNLQENIFLQKVNRKISNFKIQAPLSPFTFDSYELDQIRTSFLWHVSGSHELQCVLRELEQTNPKIPIIEICFWNMLWWKSCWRQLILDASLPFKICFCKLRSWWSWPVLIDFHLQQWFSTWVSWTIFGGVTSR